jgi:2-oxoisovalerate dehydrogenase E1 component
MMQIRDEITMLRYRSNNAFACPMVIRVPIGGYLRGGAPYHSQSGESIFAHCPGPAHRLPVRTPSMPPACCGRDPLRRPGAVPRAQAPLSPDLQQGHLPGPDYTLPFGKAAVRRPGTDLTVITGARSSSARSSRRSRPRRTASASASSTCAR